jgi:hypothetical protein
MMTMQITGKLVQVLPLQSGEGKNGTWKKQDVIIETGGNYPKKVCISFWGDKIDESKLQSGNELTIDFDIESREFNGKWYTDVKAWKVALAGAAPSGGGQQGAPMPTEEPPLASEGDMDNLPF